MTATQEQNMIALEPCPHCEARLEVSETFSNRSQTTFIHPVGDVYCVHQGAVFSSQDPERIKAWNRRAALASPAQEPVAWMHPIGAIWRADNCPAGIDFTQDGWIPLGVIAAPPAPAPAQVAVKALRWRGPLDTFPAPMWQAQVPFGFYEIEEANASDSPCYEVSFNTLLIAVKDGIDAAKAAAHADYETRIRSALAPAVGADLVERLDWQPTHRHVKRGTTYVVVGTGRVQAEEPLADDEPVVIYRGQDGGLWARHPDEFNDGRFEALAEGQATEGMDAWHAHDLIPGRAYESQNWGTVKYAGLDTYHGETTHEFRGSMPCGGARYIKSEKLGEFLKPKPVPSPAVQS